MSSGSTFIDGSLMLVVFCCVVLSGSTLIDESLMVVVFSWAGHPVVEILERQESISHAYWLDNIVLDGLSDLAESH